MTSRTIFDKIWDGHTVHRGSDGVDLLYVDLHLIHEVTSPQAFEGLRAAGRTVRRPELTVATADHGVPTTGREQGVRDPMSATQIALLEENCRESRVTMFGLDDPRQGIVHVVGPERGLTQPGMIIVCGDSHTSTHGAVGALAFGIGTTEVEHVLATQTLAQARPRTLALDVAGALPEGVEAKDLILAIIAEIGVSGAARHVIEYRGDAIRRLSMEQRMTVCNMSIEAGARAGLISPDEATFTYLEGRPSAPTGDDWDAALDAWQALPSDAGAEFDRTITFEASTLAPQVTWGTNPAHAVPVTGAVPDPADLADPAQRDTAERALRYMALAPGTPITDITIDRVFLGSCTNARIEDLRAAARIVAGRRVRDEVTAIAVPGSMAVKAQAEAEGLDRILIGAGFEWRDAGCSSCLGMNDDLVGPGERCASTSNRNFEGRQGSRARTHLVSPAMAAAAAVSGTFVDVRAWDGPS